MKFSKHLTTDSATLARIIQTYAKTNQLNKSKQLHSQLIAAGYPLCTYLANHLINTYSKCGGLDYAVKLFDRMSQRNLVSWTAMITGFSQNQNFTKAIETFCEMRNFQENPTQFAFSSVVQACAYLGSIGIGRLIHCLALKSGFGCELFVGSNLVDMYSKRGIMRDAVKVFEEMECKDEVLWTAIIDGYAKNGDFKGALLCYKKMMNNDGIAIDHYVLSSILSACGALKVCKFGKCLHSIVLKLGYEFEISVGNALTDMYSKVGDMESALDVFGLESEYKNILSFSSLIDGYVEMDQVENAFGLFIELRRKGMEPNEFTFSSLIKACANQAILDHGTQLHAQVIKFNFDGNLFVSSVLVDMYGKCGLVDDSIQVFDEIENPTEIAWNSLISVFAQHGLAKDAMEAFNRMVQRGIKPNSITFVSLLIGCSHAGLTDEGLSYFYSMEKTYGVKPKEEHYSCVIDLLSRSGRLKESEEFINKMPFEPNAYGWCSFLGACRIYGDKKRGEIAAKKLMKLEPENSGARVLLSNIYAKERQWEEVRNMRKMMRDDNLKKLPGYSWVDYGSRTHIFGAEEWSHPNQKEIYEKLDCLLDEIMEVGYIPCTDSVPLDMDERMKIKILHHHSERIAIAFALISMPAGKPIIVKKNLRVCSDCHSAIKYISKVTRRKIIVRDNSRFHHFVDGVCSCGDFW